MNSNKDPLEQIIVEDFLKSSKAIDEKIEKAGIEPMPPEVKARIKEKLHKQIEEYERERLYAQLSEEDRKALEIGRRMLADAESAKAEEKVIYHKKRRRCFSVVAAVAVLVLAMGITSIGGAEKIVEMVKIMIGGREVVKVNTDKDNYIVTKTEEEEAYQKIKDVFGVDPVKIFHLPQGMEFSDSEIDRELQTAWLVYEYNENNIYYFMSSHFTESSWAVDIEDDLTDCYEVESMNGKIEVCEYESRESQIRSYSAKYTYNGIEYFLTGAMEREKFDFLVENLIFF